MQKSVSKLTIVLISIIIILLGVLGYGVYTGFRVKAELANLNSQIRNLVDEKNDLTSQLDLLQKNYNLLKDDVFELEKSCLSENACRGHFPNVRWYCNNVGDETNVNPSHVCICDSACSLNITEIKNALTL